jgi:beta-lactamase class A
MYHGWVTFTRRACLAMAGAGFCRAAAMDLAAEWRRIAAECDGICGAAAQRVDSGQRISLHGDERFPLASVCKLPIAMAILEMAAEKKLSLNDEIEIPPYDVVPGVSPLAERWPGQKRFRLDEMIEVMVTKSDNTAVQTLFRMAGGAAGMAARMRAWHTGGMRVDRDERTCGLEAMGVKNIPPVSQWTPRMADTLVAQVPPTERIAAMRRFLSDPRDTGTPNATVDLLRDLYGRTDSIGKRLRAILEATTTGDGRIKGLLPKATVVGHKTGTTATAGNLNGSTNDVGVIVLPSGALLAVAFYLKGSTRDLALRERTIARMSRAAFGWAMA